MDLLAHRLHNQHLAGAPLDRPEDVVRWLGAVQSQDYSGATWSLVQRVKNATDAAIDVAFSTGSILRTHVLRPTWRFVTPADMRSMLQLTAPHVHALNAYYYRKLELDDALFRRSHKLFAKALQGGTQLTRKALADILSKDGIVADKLRLAHIMMRAELDGLECSGALRGKEQTYALLDERAPNAKTLGREEALGELASRFFTSHAPATVKHFAWWSGLSIGDAKIGCELSKHQLTSEVTNGQTFWFSAHVPVRRTTAPLPTYLIPEYDEALIRVQRLRRHRSASGKQIKDVERCLVSPGYCGWKASWDVASHDRKRLRCHRDESVRVAQQIAGDRIENSCRSLRRVPSIAGSASDGAALGYYQQV